MNKNHVNSERHLRSQNTWQESETLLKLQNTSFCSCKYCNFCAGRRSDHKPYLPLNTIS